MFRLAIAAGSFEPSPGQTNDYVLGYIPKNDEVPKGIPQKVFNHPVENTILGRGGNGSPVIWKNLRWKEVLAQRGQQDYLRAKTNRLSFSAMTGKKAARIIITPMSFRSRLNSMLSNNIGHRYLRICVEFRSTRILGKALAGSLSRNLNLDFALFVNSIH